MRILTGLIAFLFLTTNADANFLVTTVNPSAVKHYDDNAQFIENLTDPSVGRYSGLAQGSDGLIYAADTSVGKVVRFDLLTGQLVDVFVNSVDLTQPGDLTFGPDGNLYIAQFGNYDVLRFDGTTGNLIDVFVAEGSGGLHTPLGLIFGPDGHLYVSSRSISGCPSCGVKRYDGLTGAYIDDFVSGGSGGMELPKYLTFGPDLNLYVSCQGDNTVKKYDGSTGAYLGNFVVISATAWPSGCVFGPDGNFYVAEYRRDRVSRWNGTTGAFIDNFVQSGSGALHLEDPEAILFADDPVTSARDILVPDTWGRIKAKHR